MYLTISNDEKVCETNMLYLTISNDVKQMLYMKGFNKCYIRDMYLTISNDEKVCETLTNVI